MGIWAAIFVKKSLFLVYFDFEILIIL